MNYFYILPVINLKSLVSIWLTRLLARRSYSKRDLNPHSRNGQRILSPSCLPFHHSSILSKRAENETRTRDPNLGKVMLYQLSYFRIFSFAVAKVGIFRKHANILPTFFTEICSLCTYRKTIILIINSFGHDNLHKKIACIFQLSPLLSKWQWQDDEFR